VDRFRNIDYSVRDGVLELKVPGPDFVVEEAQDLVELVFEQFDDGPEHIVLDLGSVGYINSSGISVIIRLNLERTLRLVNPSRNVSEILELTGVLPFVPNFPTVEEAFASF